METAGIDVDALYQRYGPMVLRRCRQLLRDEDEAMDALQDVFVNLIRSRERLTDAYPSSLLYRMATNRCLNRLRDRARAPSLPGDEVLNQIAERVDLDTPIWVDRLLGRHPESTRVMAVLHYLDGMTLAQVARECRMSVSGVRKRLRGLRASLQKMEES
ncbi:MAG: sigma-70 family RNA polymerase sigma factor [Vicinamibacteria bacterium]|jgi:RNA polymerase sigma-70 factor (ECF subfamily)|nr:sigma-70 family RNA polymerase sigma factor [Vicinamibacteria bacterium]